MKILAQFTEGTLCPFCELPLVGEVAFDPRPPFGQPKTPLHPDCARSAAQEEVNRCEAEQIRLAKAAPVLLAALYDLLTFGRDAANGKPSRRAEVAMSDARAAIALTEGRAK